MSLRPLLVVAGIGAASGTGAAVARLFARSGYSVALISRVRASNDTTDTLAREINQSGGKAAGFNVPDYTPSSLSSAFDTISTTFPSRDHIFRTAIWNAGHAVWKPFLETTEADLQETMSTNIHAPWAFARNVILKMKENPADDKTGKGALIFTGATASLRGNTRTSAFSTAKSGLRALSQSLSKEFGPSDEIHVAHAIIDGLIKTGSAVAQKGDKMTGLDPDSIAKAYLTLAEQEKTAWTWELDLRPAAEQW